MIVKNIDIYIDIYIDTYIDIYIDIEVLSNTEKVNA